MKPIRIDLSGGRNSYTTMKEYPDRGPLCIRITLEAPLDPEQQEAIDRSAQAQKVGGFVRVILFGEQEKITMRGLIALILEGEFEYTILIIPAGEYKHERL